MKIKTIGLPDVKLIETIYTTDFRGTNIKVFSSDEINRNGISFLPLEVLILHSHKNVIRGLHYQEYYEQSRLIGCSKGKLYVVALNVMRNSTDFRKYCAYTLHSPNQCIYIPKGYAVGTCAIEESDFYCMLAENPFMAKYNKGILWSDEEIGINWPISPKDAITSAADAAWPTLKSLPEDN